ncbi:hypothetical protein [Arthrobacter globiformis]|uniref:hypothetical protein n=1 Tax=Arthrobacter globiformis TaxID=1665 RepID=UPI0027D90E72|nr:hypothetical protein [Arthrobacter globiformis]
MSPVHRKSLRQHQDESIPESRVPAAAHQAPPHTLPARAQNNLVLADADDNVGVSSGFVDIFTQSDYVRAAKSEHTEQTGSVALGAIGASWTIDGRGTSLHVTLDALSTEYPPLSGVRVRVTTEVGHVTYLLAFAGYDSEYVVSDLSVPLATSKFTVSVDLSRLDFPGMSTLPEGLLAESIAGAGPETFEAWKSIAEKAPKGSAFSDSLAKILRYNS